ncbi:hypothetical protein CCP3SC15_1390009 [Gammaproteobacteria bacterium]
MEVGGAAGGAAGLLAVEVEIDGFIAGAAVPVSVHNVCSLCARRGRARGF